MLVNILFEIMFGYIFFEALISGKVLMRTGYTYSKHSHPKTYWFSVWLVGFLLFFSTLMLLINVLGYYRGIKEKALVAAYERTFPALVADQVKHFRDKDWCKHLVYRDRDVYFVDQPYSACSTTSGKAGGFTDADTSEFQKIQRLFDNKVQSAGITYDDSGKMTSAWYVPSDCFWCDTSYYYSVSGMPPQDLGGGFDVSDKINEHWYAIIEDWP